MDSGSQEGRLAALRAGTGIPAIFARRAWPGQVRLHLAGDKSSKTWKSRQDGLHLIAQGAFAGIRNVAMHTGDEWSEQVALEHLAILSVATRWADEIEVIPGSEAPRQPGG